MSRAILIIRNNFISLVFISDIIRLNYKLKLMRTVSVAKLDWPIIQPTIFRYQSLLGFSKSCLTRPSPRPGLHIRISHLKSGSSSFDRSSHGGDWRVLLSLGHLNQQFLNKCLHLEEPLIK